MYTYCDICCCKEQIYFLPFSPMAHKSLIPDFYLCGILKGLLIFEVDRSVLKRKTTLTSQGSVNATQHYKAKGIHALNKF